MLMLLIVSIPHALTFPVSTGMPRASGLTAILPRLRMLVSLGLKSMLCGTVRTDRLVPFVAVLAWLVVLAGVELRKARM